MNLYKSFNRILIRAQEDRVNQTGIQEPRFTMMSHPYFVNTNKAVKEAMKLSRSTGANRERRKIDALTHEQEKQILACKIHQAIDPYGVQKRWALYCFIVFVIRGNLELYNLKFGDFTLGVDNIGLRYVKYLERLSKNNKVTLKVYEIEQFRPAVYSYDPDVVETFEILSNHMPPNSEDGHLFLSPIRNARGMIWFKQGINVGESIMRNWMKTMAAEAGITGDITNKSGRVTSITRMALAKVPTDVMQSVTGHQNVKSLNRYDRTLIMKHKATQALNRCPYNPVTNEAYSFDYYYNLEVKLWHANETGTLLQAPDNVDNDEDSEADELGQIQYEAETESFEDIRVSSNGQCNTMDIGMPASRSFGSGNYSGPGQKDFRNTVLNCSENIGDCVQELVGREDVVRVMAIHTAGDSGMNHSNTIEYGTDQRRSNEIQEGLGREGIFRGSLAVEESHGVGVGRASSIQRERLGQETTSGVPSQRNPFEAIMHVYDFDAPKVQMHTRREFPESFGRMIDGVRPQKFYHEGPVYHYPPSPCRDRPSVPKNCTVLYQGQAGSAWLNRTFDERPVGGPSILQMGIDNIASSSSPIRVPSAEYQGRTSGHFVAGNSSGHFNQGGDCGAYYGQPGGGTSHAEYGRGTDFGKSSDLVGRVWKSHNKDRNHGYPYREDSQYIQAPRQLPTGQHILDFNGPTFEGIPQCGVGGLSVLHGGTSYDRDFHHNESVRFSGRSVVEPYDRRYFDVGGYDQRELQYNDAHGHTNIYGGISPYYRHSDYPSHAPKCHSPYYPSSSSGVVPSIPPQHNQFQPSLPIYQNAPGYSVPVSNQGVDRYGSPMIYGHSGYSNEVNPFAVASTLPATNQYNQYQAHAVGSGGGQHQAVGFYPGIKGSPSKNHAVESANLKNSRSNIHQHVVADQVPNLCQTQAGQVDTHTSASSFTSTGPANAVLVSEQELQRRVELEYSLIEDASEIEKSIAALESETGNSSKIVESSPLALAVCSAGLQTNSIQTGSGSLRGSDSAENTVARHGNSLQVHANNVQQIVYNFHGVFNKDMI